MKVVYHRLDVHFYGFMACCIDSSRYIVIGNINFHSLIIIVIRIRILIPYDIKKLTSAETRYCNELFLDRINTHLGFSSLRKAVRSIVQYKRDNSCPYTPRVDYTNLYKIIEERYGGNLNV